MKDEGTRQYLLIVLSAYMKELCLECFDSFSPILSMVWLPVSSMVVAVPTVSLSSSSCSTREEGKDATSFKPQV